MPLVQMLFTPTHPAGGCLSSESSSSLWLFLVLIYSEPPRGLLLVPQVSCPSGQDCPHLLLRILILRSKPHAPPPRSLASSPPSLNSAYSCPGPVSWTVICTFFYQKQLWGRMAVYPSSWLTSVVGLYWMDGWMDEETGKRVVMGWWMERQD